MRCKQNQQSRRSFLGICGSLAAGAAWSTLPANAENTQRQLRAGIAAVDISPQPGISLAGHFHDRIASSVHDPLYARSLVLDDGDTKLAFVMVDNCLVQRPIFDAAKKQIFEQSGIAPENMLMAATHTHTAPTVTPVFQSNPDSDYVALLEKRIVESVLAAADNLEPARIAVGQGAVPDEVFNRRWHMKPGTIPPNPFGESHDVVRMNPPRGDESLIEPAGPTDPAVPFIALRRLDNPPLAILANYALHYVGGTDAGAVSADYFGCFTEVLTDLMQTEGSDAPFLAMLSNGASGDVNNINFRVPGEPAAPYEKMRAVAEKVANEVHAQYQLLTFQDWVPLNAALTNVELGVRKPNEQELERAKAIVNAVEGPEMKTSEEVYARETLLLAEYPDSVSVPLQAIRIGDAAIAAIPCEVFSEIGLAIKANSPFSLTFPIELANGYNGYLPTARQHTLGGYETWRARSSYLEVTAADTIQETVVQLLNQVRG